MINQQCYQLGAEPSVIRALFAYGLQQAAIVGPENVYDYSLGNPSIPAPAAVNASILDIVTATPWPPAWGMPGLPWPRIWKRASACR